MAGTAHTFRKEERLKSRKLIETLFREGKAFSVFPYRVICLSVNMPANRYPVQAGFSVSKRNFGKAASRNRIKRITREAYRLQKQNLYEALGRKDLQLALFFIYTDKKIHPYPFVFRKISVILERIVQELKEES